MNSGLAVFVLLSFVPFVAFAFDGCDDSMSEYVTEEYPAECESWTQDPVLFEDYVTCRDNQGLKTEDALSDCYKEIISLNETDDGSSNGIVGYVSSICPNNNEQALRYYCCVMFHSLELSNPLMNQSQMEAIDQQCY